MVDQACAVEPTSRSSSVLQGKSKHLKVALLDNVKQLIKQRKQQIELVTIIARIDGKVPSLKTLFDWAMSTFSQAVQNLCMRGHGYFEIEFKSEAEKLKAFLEGPFFLYNNSISISPWSPSLNTIIPTSTSSLKHPIWMQFYRLTSPMKCDPIIMHLAQKIEEVLHVESSSSYCSKTCGQRVQILVSNLEDLPERIFLDIEDMRIDDSVVVEYSSLLN